MPVHDLWGFDREFNLGDNARVWANNKILDEVAAACKADGKIGVDLTALLRNAGTTHQSVIDRKP
jgi:hypothetical protein